MGNNYGLRVVVVVVVVIIVVVVILSALLLLLGPVECALVFLRLADAALCDLVNILFVRSPASATVVRTVCDRYSVSQKCTMQSRQVKDAPWH